MKIEVLGSGCARCDQLYQNTKAASAKLEPTDRIEVVKVGDVNYFVKMGVFTTPGLIVNGEVVSVGKVLSAGEIKTIIQEKLE